MEFEVNGQNYRSGRLDAKRQFHLARRLSPVMASMAGQTEDHLFGNIADAVANMPDDQCDYILDTCLMAVSRQQGDKWVKVWNERAKAMQFDDIDLSSMLKIAQNVITENLGGFFGGLPGQSGSSPATT